MKSSKAAQAEQEDEKSGNHMPKDGSSVSSTFELKSESSKEVFQNLLLSRPLGIASEACPGCVLFVANVSVLAAVAHLEKLFGQIGPMDMFHVVRHYVKKTITGVYIKYEHLLDANLARIRFDKFLLHGQPLSVGFSVLNAQLGSPFPFCSLKYRRWKCAKTPTLQPIEEDTNG